MSAIKKEVVIGDCPVNGCFNSISCKGFCERHYRRFLKYGDPIAGKTEKGAPIKFLENLPDLDGCINWPFRITADGYGQIRYQGKNTNAHRISLIVNKGEPDNLTDQAAHKPLVCHNRACVNPNHLRWASPKENCLDRKIDKTEADFRGSKHGASKLTEREVIKIRKSNKLQKHLAEIYGVSKQTISRIQRLERWKHV